MLIESDGANGSLLVATMIFGGVGILAAAEPGFAFGGRDEIFWIAEADAMRAGEVFGTL